ncbi:hypothetical protein BDR03DRAFT_970956 [Suillus americanus]|nr:hypothetical protein BDR03DRAFT_970956 [Suillus americanus]
MTCDCDDHRQAGSCFTVLIKSHVGYLARCDHNLFVTNALSESIFSKNSDLSWFFLLAQLFLLGPRLILGVRKHIAMLVANHDVGAAMTSFTFQERVHLSTNSSV